jgi:hypothetical protein
MINCSPHDTPENSCNPAARAAAAKNCTLVLPCNLSSSRQGMPHAIGELVEQLGALSSCWRAAAGRKVLLRGREGRRTDADDVAGDLATGTDAAR